MDWDKSFTGDTDEVDDDVGNKVAHMMSEQEENHLEKVGIVRCGKILWRSIIFGLYMMLVIIIVQNQIESHNSYMVNEEINNYVKSLYYYVPIKNPSYLSEL